ncbi:hypothetical protein [Flavobacterium sp. HNIBRBA15423]|uniref:hypothetical protein n=1 Tax=Flavobacterium sp. HNIBRBA15423 TaxID=3458683 RepID=UPI004043F09B
MKKKIAILNFVLMLSVVLAVSYQSLHIFLQHNHTEKEIVTLQKTNTTFSKTITEKQDCHTCDFKFASFLSPENFTYSFFFPFKEIPYKFNSKENCTSININSFDLRGPPYLV